LVILVCIVLYCENILWNHESGEIIILKLNLKLDFATFVVYNLKSPSLLLVVVVVLLVATRST
jgi:hypothetical protein